MCYNRGRLDCVLDRPQKLSIQPSHETPSREARWYNYGKADTCIMFYDFNSGIQAGDRWAHPVYCTPKWPTGRLLRFLS